MPISDVFIPADSTVTTVDRRSAARDARTAEQNASNLQYRNQLAQSLNESESCTDVETASEPDVDQAPQVFEAEKPKSNDATGVSDAQNREPDLNGNSSPASLTQPAPAILQKTITATSQIVLAENELLASSLPQEPVETNVEPDDPISDMPFEIQSTPGAPPAQLQLLAVSTTTLEPTSAATEELIPPAGFKVTIQVQAASLETSMPFPTANAQSANHDAQPLPPAGFVNALEEKTSSLGNAAPVTDTVPVVSLNSAVSSCDETADTDNAPANTPSFSLLMADATSRGEIAEPAGPQLQVDDAQRELAPIHEDTAPGEAATTVDSTSDKKLPEGGTPKPKIDANVNTNAPPADVVSQDSDEPKPDATSPIPVSEYEMPTGSEQHNDEPVSSKKMPGKPTRASGDGETQTTTDSDRVSIRPQIQVAGIINAVQTVEPIEATVVPSDDEAVSVSLHTPATESGGPGSTPQVRSETSPQGSSPLAETKHVDLNPKEFVDRLSLTLRESHDSGRQLRMRLNPPELGTLQVEVSLHGGSMSARLDVQTTTAQQIIVEHLSLLHEALAQHGTTIDRIEVQVVRNWNDDAGTQSGREQGRQFDQQSSGRQSQPQPQPETEQHNSSRAQTSESFTSQLDQLDIQI